MVTVVKLPKCSRIKRAAAERLRQAIKDADVDLPKDAAAILDNALHSITHIPGARAVFTMITNDQFRYVSKEIQKCRNVATTYAVWNAAITYVRQDTGEILASREQLAKEADTLVCHVSTAMTDLEKIGAILKSKRGRNVVYLVNPHVAWNGGEGARVEACRTAPKLQLVSDEPEPCHDAIAARATEYLRTQSWGMRAKWAKRAVQKGAPMTETMTAKEYLGEWSRWIALDLVHEGLIDGAI